jgi:three-Cys-motif partner protein
MVNKKKEVIDFLKEYTWSDEAKEIINSSETINNEGFNLWSFKKLIFLEYYIKPYLLILSKTNKCKCYFIDFFSSCGANEVENENISSIGSPIVSLLKGVIPNHKDGLNNRFLKWIFMEQENKFHLPLENRVKKTCEIIKKKTNEDLTIGKDILLYKGDSNILINQIVKQIEIENKNEKFAVLAFIDPYKFSDVEWKALETLLKLKYVDIIYTLPTTTMKRGIDGCKQKEKYLSPSIMKLCLSKNFNNISEEKIREEYAKDIVSIVKRDISYHSDPISVKNNLNTEIYCIELFSHSKKAVEISENAAIRLNKISCSMIRQMLEQIKGKQRSLSNWLSK